MKRLPIDLQSFKILHEDNCLYIDKTRFIHKMLERGRYFFMARPRRFGKSLMVSVLRCFFQNQRELFEGLWIAEHGSWKWDEYPVITLDFNAIPHDTPENLQYSLDLTLDEFAAAYGIELRHRLLSGKFRELILSLYEKTGKPVVVLIDEYDKSIITHLGKGSDGLDIAKANRDILKSFLGTLKGADASERTRFVFITGVSKFSRVSIFSDLNNLIDLSMDENYADMFGYTQAELESCFKYYVEKLADKTGLPLSDTWLRLKQYYDGYQFTEKELRVYNPFSVLRALSLQKFENYWFETGTPTFLVNLIRENQYPVTDIEALELPEELFSVYDLDRLYLEPLLFQTGYLTIRHFDGALFYMGYPNQEVRVSFLSHLFNDFTRMDDIRLSGAYKRLAVYLREHKIKEFIQTAQSILASIPYTQIADRDEAYYHTVFYLMVAASGVDVKTEVLTSRGRMDLLMESDKQVVIAELKCNRNSKKAIKQILDKKYYEKFLSDGRPIYLMGINFNSEKRTIDDWQWGPLADFLKRPNDIQES